MEADERPSKAPRLEGGEPGTASVSSPPESSIAAAVPGLPSSEAEGTHATTLQSAAHSTDPVIAHGNETTATTDALAGMSKSARKKLLKRQAWDATAAARKLAKRAKQKASRQAKRAAAVTADANAEAGEDATAASAPAPGPGAPRSRSGRHRLAGRTPPLPVGIVLDCGFDELMLEKEIISLASQVTRSYSDNALAAPRHARLVVAGLDGRLLQRFNGPMCGHYKNWRGVEVRTDSLADVLSTLTFSAESAATVPTCPAWASSSSPSRYPPPTSLPTSSGDGEDDSNGAGSRAIPSQRTVYLTADATETLTELSPFHTYIVGALVDRNRHKGLCAARAEKLGIPTAKLPLAEHLQMNSRRVLATNHVVEIMLHWLNGLGWAGALERVMPKRKGAVMKEQEGKGGEDYEGKDAAVDVEDEEGEGGEGAEEELDGDGEGREGGEEEEEIEMEEAGVVVEEEKHEQVAAGISTSLGEATYGTISTA